MEFVNDQMDADVGSSVNEVILQPGSAHPQTLSRPDASGVSGNAGNVLGGQNASDSGYMLSVPPVDNGNIFGGQVGSGSSGSLDRQSNNKQYEQEQELPQQQMLLDGGNQQDQSPSQPVVIDWPAALEQCGGDQEFLIELLDDFWAEISSQLSTLKRMLGEVTFESGLPKISPPAILDFVRIKQVCHSIKGAAANLMCPMIREKAFTLEKFSSDVVASGGSLSNLERVSLLFAELIESMNKFKAMIDTNDFGN